MGCSISVPIATLLLSIAILPAAAQSQTTVATTYAVNQVQPFNLAYLAYQGYFKDLGIPSNGALLNAISFGKVTAQDIIQAAVKVNRLSEQSISDRSYHDHLEKQLKELAEN